MPRCGQVRRAEGAAPGRGVARVLRPSVPARRLPDIAPDGWEQSPVLACFHPSLEQRYEEAVQLHRNLEELSRAMRRGDAPERKPRPQPTLDEIRSEYRAEPVNVHEDVAELIGLCL